MSSPLFRNVLCLPLSTTCKILAAIHLIGSIIYIALGRIFGSTILHRYWPSPDLGIVTLNADEVSTSHKIAYPIVIACTLLNVANAFLIYFGVDKRNDKYLLPTFVLMIILGLKLVKYNVSIMIIPVAGSVYRVIDADYSHIVSIIVCLLTLPVVYSAWQEIKEEKAVN